MKQVARALPNRELTPTICEQFSLFYLLVCEQPRFVSGSTLTLGYFPARGTKLSHCRLFPCSWHQTLPLVNPELHGAGVGSVGFELEVLLQRPNAALVIL